MLITDLHGCVPCVIMHTIISATGRPSKAGRGTGVSAVAEMIVLAPPKYAGRGYAQLLPSSRRSGRRQSVQVWGLNGV